MPLLASVLTLLAKVVVLCVVVFTTLDLLLTGCPYISNKVVVPVLAVAVILTVVVSALTHAKRWRSPCPSCGKPSWTSAQKKGA